MARGHREQELTIVVKGDGVAFFVSRYIAAHRGSLGIIQLARSSHISVNKLDIKLVIFTNCPRIFSFVVSFYSASFFFIYTLSL